MSYAVSPALQTAVYQALVSDPALGALVGGNIFDMPPAGALPQLYVSLGPEEARDRSDVSGQGTRLDFSVSVVGDGTGFQAVKNVAAAVVDALVDAPLVLARGRLVGLNFLRARARRGTGGEQREIDLRFRALVEDD
ncbi:DUF3168 domain-containing protein [Maritimibacter sp. 55A14]|uniref:DUF3168 domain-containing protein n=1 Tax=Maritimibacter sp. 55A14 TaxID=2174844 RepID=UPI000D61758B|nr:DUF3168 domain-containing protein [Maritimibacter sp. 55A14]PWE30649.1 DUF3168 domain-containing protein [Maritimibacter sp. 55A14]